MYAPFHTLTLPDSRPVDAQPSPSCQTDKYHFFFCGKEPLKWKTLLPLTPDRLEMSILLARKNKEQGRECFLHRSPHSKKVFPVTLAGGRIWLQAESTLLLAVSTAAAWTRHPSEQWCGGNGNGVGGCPSLSWQPREVGAVKSREKKWTQLVD